MNPYFKITLRTFTIWVLAALLNALFCGTYLWIIEPYGAFAGEIIIAFFISLFFAAPGFFLFWIIMLVVFNKGIFARALFRAALSAALFLSCITVVVCFGLFSSFSPGEKFVFPLFIILSGVISVMMHFKYFKTIT